MKLTIIPIDGAVYENDVCYVGLTWQGTPENVHALQWENNAGWIEFNDGNPNEIITSLPAWANNAMDAWTVENNSQPTPPTPEEIQQYENEIKALKLLKESDFSQLPDVNLANKSEWDSYRAQLRNIATNPPSVPVQFPSKPPIIWA